MHTMSEAELKALVFELSNKHHDKTAEDIWPLYSDEAIARYSKDDGGDRVAYNARATEIWHETRAEMEDEDDAIAALLDA
jgi:hypothetical protein